MVSKTKVIYTEGIKLGVEFRKLGVDLCFKYIIHPPNITLNYLKRHFKDLNILYANTRNNKKENRKL